MSIIWWLRIWRKGRDWHWMLSPLGVKVWHVLGESTLRLKNLEFQRLKDMLSQGCGAGVIPVLPTVSPTQTPLPPTTSAIPTSAQPQPVAQSGVPGGKTNGGSNVGAIVGAIFGVLLAIVSTTISVSGQVYKILCPVDHHIRGLPMLEKEEAEKGGNSRNQRVGRSQHVNETTKSFRPGRSQGADAIPL